MRTKNSDFELLLIVCFISVLINLYWGWYYYPNHDLDNIQIPNKDHINNFCKANNYKYGWLDSFSCKENEVMCYKEIYNFKKYDCLKWKNI